MTFVDLGDEIHTRAELQMGFRFRLTHQWILLGHARCGHAKSGVDTYIRPKRATFGDNAELYDVIL